MTGGLAYILRTRDHEREHDNESRMNRESVRLAAIEAREEVWLPGASCSATHNSLAAHALPVCFTTPLCRCCGLSP